MTSKLLYPIFEKQLDNIRLAGKLTADDVRILHSHFSTISSKSFELVKCGAVTKIASKSGRHIFRVSDDKNDAFICNLKPRYYCSCNDFLQQVIFEDRSIMCAHIMAVFLSDALKLLVLENLEDIPFAEDYYQYLTTEHK